MATIIQENNGLTKLSMSFTSPNDESFKEEMAYSQVDFAFLGWIQKWLLDADSLDLDAFTGALNESGNELLTKFATKLTILNEKAESVSNGLNAISSLLNASLISKNYETGGTF